jgi:broad specificity phosphatase PhoE
MNKVEFINLYFIRHGYSCANYKKDIARNFLEKLIFFFTKPKDPHLTDKGIEDLKNYKKRLCDKIPKPDIIFSSYLLRAMQTASYLFPNRKINIAPHVGEIGYGRDNTPNKPSIQYKNFRTERNKNRSILLYPYLGEKKFETDKKRRLNDLDNLFKNYKIKVDKPINDFKKFLIWFNQYIQNSSKKINNIVVVSHGNYMKKLFRSLNIDINKDVNNKPNNASIIKIVLKRDNQGIKVYKK